MNTHCLTTAGGRVHKRVLDRGAQGIVGVANCVQLPHVSFTCLKTPNIIITNVTKQPTNMAVVSAHSLTFQPFSSLSSFVDRLKSILMLTLV